MIRCVPAVNSVESAIASYVPFIGYNEQYFSIITKYFALGSVFFFNETCNAVHIGFVDLIACIFIFCNGFNELCTGNAHIGWSGDSNRDFVAAHRKDRDLNVIGD